MRTSKYKKSVGVSLNKSLLRRICAYLNARFSGILDDGLRFRPGQLLKDGGHVAVFPEGFCDRVDFVPSGRYAAREDDGVMLI